MKRLIAISLIAVMAFGVIAGCGKKEEGAEVAPGAEAASEKGGGATMDTSTK